LKYKEEYKLDRPETIGETDHTFDLDNYREWLEERLTECRKQLSMANVVDRLPEDTLIRDNAREMDEKEFEHWWWETVYKGN